MITALPSMGEARSLSVTLIYKALIPCLGTPTHPLPQFPPPLSRGSLSVLPALTPSLLDPMPPFRSCLGQGEDPTQAGVAGKTWQCHGPCHTVVQRLVVSSREAFWMLFAVLVTRASSGRDCPVDRQRARAKKAFILFPRPLDSHLYSPFTPWNSGGIEAAHHPLTLPALGPGFSTQRPEATSQLS